MSLKINKRQVATKDQVKKTVWLAVPQVDSQKPDGVFKGGLQMVMALFEDEALFFYIVWKFSDGTEGVTGRFSSYQKLKVDIRGENLETHFWETRLQA